jgi:membrane protein YdbS with pleckstrin-like domain
MIQLLPDPRYKGKLFTLVLLGWVFICAWWTLPLGYGLGYLIDESVSAGLIAALVTNGILLALANWAAVAYFRTIRYEIHPDEVVVYAGIVTRSVKHVPFRTVTNLKLTRGPLDRLFRIGALAIQTAGMSGTTGAEENLAGLTDAQAVYEQVAGELRRFRGSLAPTQADDDISPAAPSDGLNQQTLDAILEELRAIRRGLEQS